MGEGLQVKFAAAERVSTDATSSWDLDALVEFLMLMGEDRRQPRLDGFDEARQGVRRALLEIGLALSSRVTASAYQGVLKMNCVGQTSCLLDRYATEMDQLLGTVRQEEEKWGTDALWASVARRDGVDDEYDDPEPDEAKPFRLVTDEGIGLYEQFHRREISLEAFMSAYRRIVPDPALAEWQRLDASLARER